MNNHINHSIKNDHPIVYSDNLSEKEIDDVFTEWLENAIKPFRISHFDDSKYFSVILDQHDYWYDWVQELKIEHRRYGDGHCYNDAFKEYLETNFKDLNDRLKYDSENGMFCVYCNNRKDAENVAYKLSNLYKDEQKMINLIKYIKEKYDYEFEVNINI